VSWAYCQDKAEENVLKKIGKRKQGEEKEKNIVDGST
jgi:hypothetical protein